MRPCAREIKRSFATACVGKGDRPMKLDRLCSRLPNAGRAWLTPRSLRQMPRKLPRIVPEPWALPSEGNNSLQPLGQERPTFRNVQGDGRVPLCAEASLSTVFAQHSASFGFDKSRTVTSALLTIKAFEEAYRDAKAKQPNIVATRNATQFAIGGVAMTVYALVGNNMVK